MMEKKLLSVLIAALLAISMVPLGLAYDDGEGIGINIDPEDSPVWLWQCEDLVMLEDCVESGRFTDCNDFPHLLERTQNYAFEGERIWNVVLAMDKNKIEQVEEVVGTLGDSQGIGNDIEVECQRMDAVMVNERYDGVIPSSCNARIQEEDLTGTEFDSATQAFYICDFTVETPDSMYGEYFYTVEAISVDSEATIDENTYWYLNPIIALAIDGDVEFEDVRPGTVAYSNTILVGNDDGGEGTGVMLDMFISGTDFYDPDSSGARCPASNRLKLSQDLRSQASLGPALADSDHKNTACDIDTWINDPSELGVDDHDHLCYYASSGAYDTGFPTITNADAEGYAPIAYSDAFTRDFYNDAEIIGTLGPLYSPGNVLSPGAEMSITFKLGLPEPCVGSFSDGSIYFWAEAV